MTKWLTKLLGKDPSFCTDKTDRLEKEGDLSVMSVPALDKNLLLENFEERLSIVEMEGQQPPDQAKRIATQDAFITVLTSLPWEEDQGKKDWLNLRIKKSQDWLSSQNWEG